MLEDAFARCGDWVEGLRSGSIDLRQMRQVSVIPGPLTGISKCVFSRHGGLREGFSTNTIGADLAKGLRH
jgi:hypothetical protein